MLFFANYSLISILTALGVVAGLVLINEVTRRSKIASICVYIALPVLLTLFWWPRAMTESAQDWFGWVKTYSALAGVIGFMAIRYIPKLEGKKFSYLFPGLILAFNILEAVFKDFQTYAAGLTENTVGGVWNLMNAAAGILLILTITGWCGIRMAKTKSRDMVWPDMLWFWIIAYDLWNMAYCYNCLTVRSFYAGFLLLVASTLAEFLFKKGVWLQHRAQTLALWGMFSLSLSYAQWPAFSITSTNKPEALFILSALSLVANIAVFVLVVIRTVRARKNPWKNELFTDTAAYKKNITANNLT